jgi:hypothetical protein
MLLLAAPSKSGIGGATGGIGGGAGGADGTGTTSGNTTGGTISGIGGADGIGGFDGSSGTTSGKGKLGTTSGNKLLLKLIASNVTSFFLLDEALLFGFLSPANTSPVTIDKNINDTVATCLIRDFNDLCLEKLL